MTWNTWFAGIAAGMLVAGTATTAAAFHPAASFEKTANEGGGGGVYFTGSSRHKGYDCSICHVDPSGIIDIRVTSNPPDLAAGTYVPGETYSIDVALIGEHRGFGSQSNPNTFLAELVSGTGVPLSGFTEVDLDLFELLDGGRVLATKASSRTEWSFRWRAPSSAEAEGIVLHVGMVDGDGAGDASRALTDPLYDDVAVLQLPICPAGDGCEPTPERAEELSPAAGCRATSGAGAGSILLVVLALLAIRRRSSASVLAVFLAAGCFDPSVAEECKDRVCGENGTGNPGNTPSCAESWSCTPWEAPLGSDMATRTCVDTNSAGTTECKPDVGPTKLPALDMDFYKCKVQPIFQRGCSMMNCHGTNDGRMFRVYARGRLRNDEIVDRTGSCIPATGQVNLDQAGTGTVMCEGWLPHTELEWKKNFDSARSFMLGVSSASESDLLRQPVVGGKPHLEVKLFRDTDADYETIKQWLEGASLGTTCNTGSN